MQDSKRGKFVPRAHDRTVGSALGSETVEKLFTMVGGRPEQNRPERRPQRRRRRRS
jgi:hypothetical protein